VDIVSMALPNMPVLDLNELLTGLPALTPSFGGVMADCCAVCLDFNGHTAGVTMRVDGAFPGHVTVVAPPVTDQIKRTHHDLDRAAENGAYGIAILLIRRHAGFTVIDQSRKGTGFDYWLGDEGELFQAKARLEASGIVRAGRSSRVTDRVKKKEAQTVVSDHLLIPAYVVVVEFGSPASIVTVR
jgi:hypothetical protein